MKEILYLDTDFLNSFISQLYDGLPLEKQKSSKSTNGETGVESESDGNSKGAKVNAHIFSAGYTKDLSSTTQNTVSQNKETQDIITTRMHDNALADLEAYISDHNVAANIGNLKPGKFIKFNVNLSITGIQAVADLYNDEIVEASNLATNEDLLEQLDTLKIKIDHFNSIKGKNSVAQLKKLQSEQLELELEIHSNTEGFRKVARESTTYAKAISKILPTDYFLHSHNMLIPLSKKYFRPDLSTVNFLYGNDASDNKDVEPITLIGKITRQPIHLLNTSFAKNEVRNYADSFNKVLNTIPNMADWFKKGDFLVRPIAIYSDSTTF